MPLPFLVEGDHDEEVLCPQLEEVIGRLTGEQRWSRFLEAGSRTSEEFQEAWLTLTAEAISIFNFLEEEPSGPLSVPTAEAGGRSTDGSTRMRVVQQKEMLPSTSHTAIPCYLSAPSVRPRRKTKSTYTRGVTSSTNIGQSHAYGTTPF